MSSRDKEQELVEQAQLVMLEAAAGCAEGAEYIIMSKDNISRFRPYLKYKNALLTALSILDAVKDDDLQAASARHIAAQAHLRDAKDCLDQIDRQETEYLKAKAAAHFGRAFETRN